MDSINFHLLALQLMAAQGLLGAFDTLYHHELTEALATHTSARRELGIHAVRASIYAALFVGLSAWAWHGAWAWALMVIFGIEILLTLWDFVVEDQTRLLPATERVTHTLLAINGGAFITLLALNVPAWQAQATALVWQPQGWLSVFLALCGVGVGLSGLRDGWAARQLGWRPAHEARMHEEMPSQRAVHFAGPSQNVLVTGGTGFIGQLLVQALVHSGHTVNVLTRQPHRSAWLLKGAARCVASLDELPATVRVDVVINLAGARILGWRWSAARRAELLASRVGTTEAVVAWIASALYKPRLMMSASAIGYYGIQPRGDAAMLDENSPPQAIFMSQLCQQWEAAAAGARAYGTHVACLRLGLVLGKSGALPMMITPVRLGLGGPLGHGQQWFSWIHVQDVLRALAHIWHQPADGAAPGRLPGPVHEQVDGAWNFTAPDVTTQAAFVRTAAQVLHRPAVLPLPALPVRWVLGEQADLLLEGQRVQPVRLQTSKFIFAFPALQGVLEDLL